MRNVVVRIRYALPVKSNWISCLAVYEKRIRKKMLYTNSHSSSKNAVENAYTQKVCLVYNAYTLCKVQKMKDLSRNAKRNVRGLVAARIRKKSDSGLARSENVYAQVFDTLESN